MSLSSAFETSPTLVEVDGASVPASFTSLEEEIRAIRESAALSARPEVVAVRLTGSGAWEVLDRLCPADLFLRDSQLRSTLLLDESGRALCDVCVGNDDDTFLLLSEGLPSAALCEHIRAHAPPGAAFELVELGETHMVLSLDGPFAWEVLATLEGPGIAGFPLLSLYHPREGSTYLRAGKTGEYGYDLLVPREEAPELWRALRQAGARMSLREVGLHALWHARLENWLFNIHREGRAADVSPLELQLQWRLAREDKDYVGRAALRSRAWTHRATALVGESALRVGDPVTYRGRTIGSVLVADTSVTLGLPIAMALLERPFAHSGIDRFAAGGVRVRTVSPPFVNNLSMFVSPDRHSWAGRHEIAFPGPRRRGIAPP